MFKLLTESEKNKVVHEYNVRRLVVMLGALVGVLVVGLVGLFPSYILSSAKKSEVIDKQKLTMQQLSPEDENLKAWLTDTNHTLTLMSPELDKDKPYELFKSFIEERVTGISINSLSWIREGETIRLKVSGIANTRKVLINYEDKINNSGHFTNVALPVSNLANDKDIDFEITVSPK